MAKRKYSYFNVATPYCSEVFYDYHDALKFYGRSESPATLYGVSVCDGDGDIIKSK